MVERFALKWVAGPVLSSKHDELRTVTAASFFNQVVSQSDSLIKINLNSFE